LLGYPRSAGTAPGVGPPPPNKLAMPTQQRVPADEQRLPTRSPEKPAGRSKEDAVRLRQTRTSDLAAKNRQLMAEYHDLKLLELARTHTQRSHCERTPKQQIHQRHEQRQTPSTGCGRCPTLRPRSQLRRVLKQNQTDLRTPQDARRQSREARGGQPVAAAQGAAPVRVLGRARCRRSSATSDSSRSAWRRSQRDPREIRRQARRIRGCHALGSLGIFGGREREAKPERRARARPDSGRRCRGVGDDAGAAVACAGVARGGADRAGASVLVSAARGPPAVRSRLPANRLVRRF
jgi:hypothetical protein